MMEVISGVMALALVRATFIAKGKELRFQGAMPVFYINALFFQNLEGEGG